LVDLLRIALDIWCDFGEERLTIINLPNVCVEARKVDVEEGGVFLNKLEKVLLGELVLLLIKVVGCEEEVCIFFSETGHV
jgi:hypothetical protein